ncbi:hypothetical protein [Acinetobacter kanungonis]|uniref:hypothetical protein n=1 Tax=Acinetobacter kanungonis TaxID=2699469 RepID=UPI00137B69BE|nr:hypothetical protein [Acinetobacter kanungonis]NCI79742.1 hypothetical protein [Acinetobacter kanungonis]
MKKLLLLTITSTLSVGTWAANVPYKSISICQFDFDDFDYCSKANIAKYKNAIKTQKPNFNEKYILLNMSSSSKSFRFVALDTKNGIAFPLSDEILGFKDDTGGLTGKPPIIQYSLNNLNLCTIGSISAYRNSYDNVKTCYSIQDDEYSKYGKDFMRLNTPQEIN